MTLTTAILLAIPAAFIVATLTMVFGTSDRAVARKGIRRAHGEARINAGVGAVVTVVAAIGLWALFTGASTTLVSNMLGA